MPDRDQIGAAFQSAGTQFNQVQDGTHRALAAFFEKIAVMSGSAIVVSITFLNSILDLGRVDIWTSGSFAVTNFFFLYIAWILLALASICSLWRNRSHIDYLHQSALTNWCSQGIPAAKSDAQVVPDAQKEAGWWIEKLQNLIETAKPRSRRFLKAAKILGNLAQLSFLFGVIALLIFGIGTAAAF